MILPFCATVHAYMYRRHGHGDVELQLVAGTGKRHDYSMHRKMNNPVTGGASCNIVTTRIKKMRESYILNGR
jgi:hypothetical protein